MEPSEKFISSRKKECALGKVLLECEISEGERERERKDKSCIKVAAIFCSPFSKSRLQGK